jgi:integrase
VRKLLDVVPDTIQGRRDRAILLIFVLTGRRRSEVMDLKAGDITIEDSTVYYSYRGKGGKRGRRELPRPAWEAIRRTLADCGKELVAMDAEESLWQAGAGPRGLSGSTLYARFRRYLVEAGLQPAGLHILRPVSRRAQ